MAKQIDKQKFFEAVVPYDRPGIDIDALLAELERQMRDGAVLPWMKVVCVGSQCGDWHVYDVDDPRWTPLTPEPALFRLKDENV